MGFEADVFRDVADAFLRSGHLVFHGPDLPFTWAVQCCSRSPLSRHSLHAQNRKLFEFTQCGLTGLMQLRHDPSLWRRPLHAARRCAAQLPECGRSCRVKYTRPELVSSALPLAAPVTKVRNWAGSRPASGSLKIAFGQRGIYPKACQRKPV